MKKLKENCFFVSSGGDEYTKHNRAELHELLEDGSINSDETDEIFEVDIVQEYEIKDTKAELVPKL